MDLRKIKKLIELLEESNLQEMEIQEGEESIRLSRGRSSPVVHQPIQTPLAAPIAEVSPAVTTSAANVDAEEASTDNALTSPMVGTFYSAARPGDAPFVKAGDTVAVGDVLCIVEAMKIFNQIEADRPGKIVSILKESGDPVEYGESLFIIE